MNYVINGFAVIFLIAGAVLLFKDASASRAGVAFLFSVSCLFFANLDRFELFKASPTGGLEARTRAVVAQAEVSMKQLQRLAVQFAGLMIEQNAAAGRWGPDFPSADARKVAVLKALGDLSVPEDERRQVALADQRYVLIDYGAAIQNIAGALIEQQQEPGLRTILAPVMKAAMEGEATPVDVFAPEISNLVQYKSPYLERWFSSYEQYRTTGVHGDPDLWAKRTDAFGDRKTLRRLAGAPDE